jgi:hypothetical protein
MMKHRGILETYPPFLQAQTELNFLIPSLGFKTPGIKPAHTTWPASQPSHFNPEDGGSRFLLNGSFYPQYCKADRDLDRSLPSVFVTLWQ